MTQSLEEMIAQNIRTMERMRIIVASFGVDLSVANVGSSSGEFNPDAYEQTLHDIAVAWVQKQTIDTLAELAFNIISTLTLSDRISKDILEAEQARLRRN